jgi:hypothetical protein
VSTTTTKSRRRDFFKEMVDEENLAYDKTKHLFNTIRINMFVVDSVLVCILVTVHVKFIFLIATMVTF